jgi:hypothetical protein
VLDHGSASAFQEVSMPDPKPFTARIDRDALQDLLAGMPVPPVPSADGRPPAAPDVEAHHGAADGGRQAVRARQQAERARSGRASAGKSRYAFRRS